MSLRPRTIRIVLTSNFHSKDQIASEIEVMQMHKAAICEKVKKSISKSSLFDKIAVLSTPSQKLINTQSVFIKSSISR